MVTFAAWTRLKRLLLIGYLLLWPPIIILFARRSFQADVLGWWSRRVFVLLVASLAVMGVLTFLLVRWLRHRCDEPIWPARMLEQIRKRGWLAVIAGLLPPLAWLAAVCAAGFLRIEIDWRLLTVLADLALLVIVWEAGLLFVELPPAQQRQRLLKVMLAGFATLIALVAVEAVAAVLGLSRYAVWDLNPPGMNASFTTDDFDVRVVTNEQGLRQLQTIHPAHPGVYRIVIVGDSMTFGWGVENEQAYPHVVQTELREKYGIQNVEVINMGKPGSTPVDYLRVIRRYAAQLKPDLIVVGFLIGNDCPIYSPARLASSRQVQDALARYEKQTRQSVLEKLLWKSYLARTFYSGVYRRLGSLQRVETVGKRGPLFGEPNPLDPDPLEAEISRLADPQAARRRLKHLQENGWIEKGMQWHVNPWLIKAAVLHPHGAADTLAVRPETIEFMRREWQLCEGLLLEMRRAANDCGAKFAVLAIPNAHLVSTRWLGVLREMGCEVSDEMTSKKVVNDWMADFCRKNNIECVDPLTVFRQRQNGGEDLYLTTDDHMNPSGYRLLGVELANRLAKMIEADTGEPARN